jgi:arsenate reductase (glutaredoxin)
MGSQYVRSAIWRTAVTHADRGATFVLFGHSSSLHMRLYGFKSCDTVRAAIKWLDARRVTYTFIDYRREALVAATIDDWFARTGWELVFNRNSTAYRELSPTVQASLTAHTARVLILGNTNFIRRPLLDTGTQIVTGFNAARWAALLG